MSLYYNWKFWPLNVSLADRHLSHRLAAKYGTGGRLGWQSAGRGKSVQNQGNFGFLRIDRIRLISRSSDDDLQMRRWGSGTGRRTASGSLLM